MKPWGWTIMAAWLAFALGVVVGHVGGGPPEYRRGYCESRGGTLIEGKCVRVIALPEGEVK